MADCRKCSDFDWCVENEDCGLFKPKQMTNADRIRAMMDEELADRILGYVRCEACEREFHIECNPLKTCRGVWLDWLKQEVDT